MSSVARGVAADHEVADPALIQDTNKLGEVVEAHGSPWSKGRPRRARGRGGRARPGSWRGNDRRPRRWLARTSSRGSSIRSAALEVRIVQPSRASLARAEPRPRSRRALLPEPARPPPRPSPPCPAPPFPQPGDGGT